MQPTPGAAPPPEAVAQVLQQAHALVAQGQPLQALRVVAELLQAVGLDRQAGESVSRVQQALAAGSASAAAADELAGLLSLVSLQAQPAAQQTSSLPATFQQQQQQQQPPSEPVGMDLEGGCHGGTGPGPPPSGQELCRLGRLAAAADGASYVCARCGGVVALARQAAHEQLWCPALHGS